MEMLVHLVAGFLVSLPCCVLVPRMLAKAGFLDIPGERSSHSRPTPKGGGVGIVLAFMVSAWVSGLHLSLWLPPLALAVLSFVNDLKGISPALRLGVQFGAAMWVLGSTWMAGWLGWHLVLLAPALFFVVATCNFYNFMDGINGMAGLTGVVTFMLLLVTGEMAEGSADLTPVVAAVIGGLIAFLPFNVPRSRLFMGDVGSIFLGFFFAMCVCLQADSLTDFLVFASFLLPFYADEAVTIIERLWRKESLLKPHRRHFYQFLANERGVAHWKISLGYAGVQVFFALLAVMAGTYGPSAVFGLDVAILGLWACVHFGLKHGYMIEHKGE